MLQVEGLQCGEVMLQCGVCRVVQQEPFHGLFLVPCGKLPDLTAHEPQLGAGVRHHKGGEHPRAGEFLRILPGILSRNDFFPCTTSSCEIGSIYCSVKA